MKKELKYKAPKKQALNIHVVSGSYREQALEWWENLEDDEVIEVYKKTGNFRLGGWDTILDQLKMT